MFFSIAAGNYTGTKAENVSFRRVRLYQGAQLKKIPKGTREVGGLYRNEGFSGDDLQRTT